MCGYDIAEIRQMIEIIKELHKDRYEDEFVESIMKKRADIEISMQ